MPLAFHQEEQVEEAGAHGHLLVVARGQEGGAGLEGQAGGGGALLDLAGQKGGHEGLQGGVGGIEHHEVGQESREKASESSGQRLARSVTLAQPCEHLVAVQALGQALPQLLHEGGHGRIQDDVGGGLSDGLAGGAIAQGTDLAALVENGRGAHLRKIVVIGGDPEDGDHGPTAARLQQPRRLAGAQGLVKHVEGAAEEPRLLPGDDGDRPRLPELRRPRGRPRCSPRLLLAHERGRHRLPGPLASERALARFRERFQVPARTA